MKMCRGFTLLELMVTVAVVAILATVGVPGFQELIQNNRVTTQTNELVTALNFARTEAVKRGRNVQVVVAQANPGWTATVSTVGTGAEDLREIGRQGSGITVNAATVVFSPAGAPAAAVDFDMRPSSSCTGDKSRLIAIAPSGQITTTKQACPSP